MSKVLGIDPGKNTGLAIFLNGKLTDLCTSDFWGAIEHINVHHDAVVVVELPSTKHVWHGGATAKGAIQRTGVNVGSCLREAELIIAYLGRMKRQVIIEKPAGKVDKDRFQAATGWTGQTNAHTRDAGMLAHRYRNIKL